MYNGLLTRTGYLLRDPKNYGEPSPYIFAELQKRFHDALDDCEIRLLDVKWYLEQQLKENKARREQKVVSDIRAATESSATKRKRDPDDDVNERAQVETPTKRQKPVQEHIASPTNTRAQDVKSEPVQIDVETQPENEDRPPESSKQQPDIVQPQADPEMSKPEPEAPPSEEQIHDSLAAPDPSLIPPDQDLSIDDMMQGEQGSTQQTPADGDIFFESVFGAPADDDAQMNNDEMALDFMNDNFATDVVPDLSNTDDPIQNQVNVQSQQDQPSFLDGLEQYANQTDDMMVAQDFSLADSQYQDNTNLNASHDHEPNIFDQFLDGSFEPIGDMSGGDLNNLDNIENPEDKNMNWDELFDGDL